MALSMAIPIHRVENNNLFLLLVTSLLITIKDQMPEVSIVAVKQMPLHLYLPLSASPATPNSLLPHILPYTEEGARLEQAPYAKRVWVEA